MAEGLAEGYVKIGKSATVRGFELRCDVSRTVQKTGAGKCIESRNDDVS